MIEEALDGPEVSLFAVTDGVTVVPLLPAQDLKRAGDGDLGPSTRHGRLRPAPRPRRPGRETMAEVIQRPLTRCAAAARRTRACSTPGAPTGAGIRVVEFNARFGDPEKQVGWTAGPREAPPARC